VTTLRCLKIFQALQYKRQTLYYFYSPLHCKVHLTVLRVFLLGDPCWPFAPEQQNCEKCWICLYWKTTIAFSTLAYIGKLPLHAHRVRHVSLVVFVLRLVHGPKMRNFCDFHQISCWPNSVLKCQPNTNRPDMMTPGTSKAHCRGLSFSLVKSQFFPRLSLKARHIDHLNLFTLHLPPCQIGFSKKQKPSTHKQNTLDLLYTGHLNE
jgi:hypothetical protein